MAALSPSKESTSSLGRPYTSMEQRSDPRTTMRYERARQSLDRHVTYIVATFVAGASR
jgi:hypothetical protein